MASKRGKTQARRSGARNSGTPGWVWLLAGVILSGLAFGYLKYRDGWSLPVSSLPSPNPRAQAPRPSPDNAVPEPAERPRPKYEFYTLLPEKEVLIPDDELDAQARAEAAKAATAAKAAAALAANTPDASVTGTPAAATVAVEAPAASASDGARYLIQAGAFRGNTEAEALKAKIALTGEVARVEVATINGNLVHRVRMGPYPNASALAAAKQALAANGITAQAIRVK